MRRFLLLVVVAMMVIGLMAGPAMAKQVVEGYAANSLGKTTLDTTVYSSSDEEMDYGDGIPNGEWITAKTQGVEIGLRATDSTDGLLDVTGTKGNRVGVYEVSTGYDEDSTAAEWNYEWSVDLGNATGNAADMMLTDYRLTLEQDLQSRSCGTSMILIPSYSQRT